jgi:hypothetical protein
MSFTDLLLRKKDGSLSPGKIIGIPAALLFVVAPVALSALLLIGPATVGIIGVSCVAAVGVTRLTSNLLGFNKSPKQKQKTAEHFFGQPTADDKAQVAAAKSAGRSYTNFKMLTPEISDEYRRKLLGDFQPEELSKVLYTSEQIAEKKSEQTSKKMGGAILTVARDQLAALLELHNNGNLDRKVTVDYYDAKSDTTKKMPNVPYKFLVAAQRQVVLDMANLDRNANNIPLSEYNGETKKQDLNRNGFIVGNKMPSASVGHQRPADVFDVASRLSENGPWSQKSPDSMLIANTSYNYSVGKLANFINEEKANAFDVLFATTSCQELGANLQIYRDACKWGLVDHHTRALIAKRAEMHGDRTTNYSLYNFTMCCLADNSQLKGNQPDFNRVEHEFLASADRFLQFLRTTAPATPLPTQRKAGSSWTSLLDTLINPGNTSVAQKLDAIKTEATKDAFGLGTQKLATNIAALQGIASGIGNELLLGKLGIDKIKIAAQDPQTRVFVLQGIVSTLQKGIDAFAKLARGEH